MANAGARWTDRIIEWTIIDRFPLAVQGVGQQSRHQQAGHKANAQAHDHLRGIPRKHAPRDAKRCRTQRAAHTDFLAPLSNDIGQHAKKAGSGKHQGDCAEYAKTLRNRRFAKGHAARHGRIVTHTSKAVYLRRPSA